MKSRRLSLVTSNTRSTSKRANIAIITSQMKPFTGQDGLIGKIAKRIRRKIVLRTPLDAMMDMSEASEVIRSIVPEEADITEMYFDACYREVTIQCKQPGTAIGRRGENNAKIRDQTGWSVKVERTPPLFSKTVHDIRMYRQSHGGAPPEIAERFRPQHSPPNTPWRYMGTCDRTRFLSRGGACVSLRHDQRIEDHDRCWCEHRFRYRPNAVL